MQAKKLIRWLFEAGLLVVIHILSSLLLYCLDENLYKNSETIIVSPVSLLANHLSHRLIDKQPDKRPD